MVKIYPIYLKVEPFKSIVEFQNRQWYYINRDGEQKGPVFTRLLLHKLRESEELDGLSLVFGTGLDDWKRISEVVELKNEMLKISAEEEAAERALKLAQTTSEEKPKLGFTPDDCSIVDIAAEYNRIFNAAEKQESEVENKNSLDGTDKSSKGHFIIISSNYFKCYLYLIR